MVFWHCLVFEIIIVWLSLKRFIFPPKSSINSQWFCKKKTFFVKACFIVFYEIFTANHCEFWITLFCKHLAMVEVLYLYSTPARKPIIVKNPTFSPLPEPDKKVGVRIYLTRLRGLRRRQVFGKHLSIPQYLVRIYLTRLRGLRLSMLTIMSLPVVNM